MGSSTISLGLGLGGGKAATSSGTPGGGAFTNQYSVSFDGTDDNIVTASSSDFAFGTSGFSIGLWFNSNGTANTNIFDFRSSGGSLNVPSLWLRTNSGSSHIRYYVQGNGGYKVNCYDNLNTGTWYHVLIAGNGTTTSIYLNGNSTAVASGSDNTNYEAAPLTIGKYFGNNGYTWDGLIDEFAVWDACLDGNDASAIYNSGTPNDLTDAGSYNTDRTSNLVGYWRMGDNDGGTGTTITDQGSGGNDGTLTNSPTFSTTVPS
tara:strand:+ start:96 stop:878 length:783 start_codon:yes stop_codon:yes gene_type:complete